MPHAETDVAAAAALLAEPARAELVLALMDGGTLSAADLAGRAGTSTEVAGAVEALSLVAPPRTVRALREATRGELIRHARTCYDHLAGTVGVALTRALEEQHVVDRRDGTLVAGERFDEALRVFAIDGALLKRQKRPLVRGCLDWTERELHVAGAFGAAVTARLFERGYIARRDTTRSVVVTQAGERFLAENLGLIVTPQTRGSGRASPTASG